MEKRLVDADFLFVSHNQPSEVCDPGDGAFHLPSPLVASQFSAVLRRRLTAVGLVRADQIDAAFVQATSQRIRIGGFVIDQPRGLAPGPPTTPGHRYTLQRRFNQRRFVRGRRGELNSQRKTLAACHHHPLRTFSAFGFSDAGTPFFAGANEPSAKVSSQSSRPCSSSSPRKRRQMSSQTSCSSQSRSLRQQVLGEGYLAGRSFHRAPDRSTQMIPSRHARFSAEGRPPRLDRFTTGSNGSIFFHCSSVSSESSRAMKRIPFQGTFKHKPINRASL